MTENWRQAIALTRQQMESIYQGSCIDCDIHHRSDWEVCGIGYESSFIVFSFSGESRRYKLLVYRYYNQHGHKIKFGAQCPVILREVALI